MTAAKKVPELPALAAQLRRRFVGKRDLVDLQMSETMGTEGQPLVVLSLTFRDPPDQRRPNYVDLNRIADEIRDAAYARGVTDRVLLAVATELDRRLAETAS